MSLKLKRLKINLKRLKMSNIIHITPACEFCSVRCKVTDEIKSNPSLLRHVNKITSCCDECAEIMEDLRKEQEDFEKSLT